VGDEGVAGGAAVIDQLLTPEIEQYLVTEIHMLDGSTMTGAELMAAEADVCIKQVGANWYEVYLTGWPRLHQRRPEQVCKPLAWSGR
jgi:hypothetical protein